METLYEHSGGDNALHRLEELFYDKVLTDPILKVLFTDRVTDARRPLDLVLRPSRSAARTGSNSPARIPLPHRCAPSSEDYR